MKGNSKHLRVFLVYSHEIQKYEIGMLNHCKEKNLLQGFGEMSNVFCVNCISQYLPL